MIVSDATALGTRGLGFVLVVGCLGGCGRAGLPAYTGPLAEYAAGAKSLDTEQWACDSSGLAPGSTVKGPLLRCRSKPGAKQIQILADLSGRVVEVAEATIAAPGDGGRSIQAIVDETNRVHGPSRPWCDGPARGLRLQWQADSFFVVLVADTAAGTATLARTIGKSYCP